MTEERFREIIREELARAGVAPSPPEKMSLAAETRHVLATQGPAGLKKFCKAKMRSA